MANKKIILLFNFIILFPFCVFTQGVNPVLLTNLDDIIAETSGLLIYNNKVWTHNDSGGEPILYQLDTVTGIVTAEKLILNAENIDWEDICHDNMYAYIGDFGNNKGIRDDLKIYRILLSDLDNVSLNSIESEVINFTYNSEIYPEVDKENNTDFDCEALIANDDSLYLFSKNWISNNCYLYSLPKIPGNYVATRLDTLDTQGLVCGADYNPQTNMVCLIGYVYGIPAPSFMLLLSEFENNDFFGGNNLRYELNLNGYQTESIEFRNDSRFWITNENFLGHTQSLYEINLLTIGIKKISNKSVLNIYPNPTNETIIVNTSINEKLRYSIIDSFGNCLIKTYKKQYFNEPITIDVSVLPSGIYFIELIGQNCIVKSKFIKL